MRAHVLIISNPDDQHTKAVAGHIAALGGASTLFYPEMLGHAGHYVLSMDQDNLKLSLSHSNALEAINCYSIDSVWYRRPRRVYRAQSSLDDEAVAFIRDEWEATLEGAYALMNEALWVSHPDRLQAAARKPIQLQLARSLGLRVPETLITNDVVAASEFVKRYEQVIAKPSGSGWMFANEGQDISYVLANLLQEVDNNFAGLELSPVTLQEYIPKAYEARVNIVGQEVMAIRIDSQRSAISRVDWRRYDLANTPYSPLQLPEHVEAACASLAKSLGLEYGAIDLICTPDGEYVFLEINGNGQFLWAEVHSGVSVSNALARLLVGATPPLSSTAIRERAIV